MEHEHDRDCPRWYDRHWPDDPPRDDLACRCAELRAPKVPESERIKSLHVVTEGQRTIGVWIDGRLLSFEDFFHLAELLMWQLHRIGAEIPGCWYWDEERHIAEQRLKSEGWTAERLVEAAKRWAEEVGR